MPLALAFAAIATPYLWRHNFATLALAIEHMFALVCHQKPERSFFLFGGPVAVCARCLGIYLGAAAGLLVRTSQRLAVRMVVLVAALNLIDVATELLGLHGNWMIARFALGCALGAAAGILIRSVSFTAPQELPFGQRAEV